MEGFLQSFGSPCLHAPQHSCLKQGENTVNTGFGHWNPCLLSGPMTTFSSYNQPDEKRHLSLSVTYSVFTRTASANPALLA